MLPNGAVKSRSADRADAAQPDCTAGFVVWQGQNNQCYTRPIKHLPFPHTYTPTALTNKPAKHTGSTLTKSETLPLSV